MAAANRKINYAKALRKNIDDGIQIDRTCDIKLKFKRANKELVKELLDKATADKSKIQGIVYYPNATVDLTFFERKDMLYFESSVEKIRCTLNDFRGTYVYVPERINVELHHVPIRTKNEDICRVLQQGRGPPTSIECVKNEDGMLTGIRRVAFNHEIIKKHPFKSYVYIGGQTIKVKYRGQEETCHFRKDCPNITKITYDTTDKHELACADSSKTTVPITDKQDTAFTKKQ